MNDKDAVLLNNDIYGSMYSPDWPMEEIMQAWKEMQTCTVEEEMQEEEVQKLVNELLNKFELKLKLEGFIIPDDDSYDISNAIKQRLGSITAADFEFFNRLPNLMASMVPCDENSK